MRRQQTEVYSVQIRLNSPKQQTGAQDTDSPLRESRSDAPMRDDQANVQDGTMLTKCTKLTL